MGLFHSVLDFPYSFLVSRVLVFSRSKPKCGLDGVRYYKMAQYIVKPFQIKRISLHINYPSSIVNILITNPKEPNMSHHKKSEHKASHTHKSEHGHKKAGKKAVKVHHGMHGHKKHEK